MFLSASGGYNRHGEQWSQGSYLWIVQGPDVKWEECRAFVRSVKLVQSGHFMVGTIKVGGHVAYVSGAYGSDGLPVTVSQHVYDAAVPVPVELLEAWGKGDGWNGTGTEAPDMRAWALENLELLRTAGKTLPCNAAQRVAEILSPSGYHGDLGGIFRHRDRLHPIEWTSEMRESFDLSRAATRARDAAFLASVMQETQILGLTPARIARHPWRAIRAVLESWDAQFPAADAAVGGAR